MKALRAADWSLCGLHLSCNFAVRQHSKHILNELLLSAGDMSDTVMDAEAILQGYKELVTAPLLAFCLQQSRSRGFSGSGLGARAQGAVLWEEDFPG